MKFQKVYPRGRVRIASGQYWSYIQKADGRLVVLSAHASLDGAYARAEQAAIDLRDEVTSVL